MLKKLLRATPLAFLLLCGGGMSQTQGEVRLAVVEPYGLLPRTSSPVTLGETVLVKLAQGECEPAAIAVDNTRGDSENIEFQAFYVPDEEGPLPGDSARLERVVHLPARGGVESADQLLPLTDVDVVGCPAGECRYLWLTVNARGLDPGEYRGAVHVRVLSPRPARLRAPVQVTVWPFSIPQRAPIHVFTWDCGHATGFDDEYLANFVEHKVNCYMISLRPVVPPLREDGSLSRPPEFEKLTPAIERAKLYGTFMFAGGPVMGDADGPGTKAGSPWPGSNTVYMRPEWRKGFTEWFQAFLEYLRIQGLDYSQWFWYPFDETICDDVIAQAELVKEIDPNVRFWADISTDDPERLKRSLPVIDVWCPEYITLVSHLATRDDRAFRMLKEAGEEVWAYFCGRNMRTVDPTLRYRSCGWFAWKYELAGATFWNSVVNSGDRWTEFDGRGGEFATVFPTSRGYVNTRRWEAFRDGIEDYQYLHLLRQLAQNAPEDQKKEALDFTAEAADETLVEVTDAFKKAKNHAHQVLMINQVTKPDRKEIVPVVWTPEVPKRARDLREKLAGMIVKLGTSGTKGQGAR